MFFKWGVTLELNPVLNLRDLSDVQEIKISGLLINMRIGQLYLEKVLKFEGHLRYRFLKNSTEANFFLKGGI